MLISQINETVCYDNNSLQNIIYISILVSIPMDINNSLSKEIEEYLNDLDPNPGEVEK